MKMLFRKVISVLAFSILLVGAITTVAVAQDPHTTHDILDMIEATCPGCRSSIGAPGVDLSGRDLVRIDLSRETIHVELARLREEVPGALPQWISLLSDGVNLGYANLQEAYLYSANLHGADLEWANSRGGHLEGANLRETMLVGADLQDTNLAYADLQGADLMYAHLQGTNLTGANLADVNLLSAKSLDGVYIFGATLTSTNLSYHQLGGSIGEERDHLYWEAMEGYRALKVNWREMGRHDDARWAYIKERQMEKKTFWPPIALKVPWYRNTELSGFSLLVFDLR